MIKLFSNNKPLIKSFHIYEIWNFIIKNPYLKFDIVFEYKNLSHNDFCKLFLKETENYEDYIKLETTLNNTQNIF